MYVELRCIGCGTRYRVNAILEGRIVECKHCARRMVVPGKIAVIKLEEADEQPRVSRTFPRKVPPDPEPLVSDEEDDDSGGTVDADAVEEIIPSLVTEIILPLGLILFAIGTAGLSAATHAVHSANPGIAFIFMGLTVGLILLLVTPLAIYAIESCAHSLDYVLPNSVWLQSLSLMMVPTTALTLGYFAARFGGLVMGGMVGFVAMAGLMALFFRIGPTKALITAVFSALAYLFSASMIVVLCSILGVIVALTGNALPWEQTQVEPVATASAAPQPVSRPQPAPMVQVLPTPQPAPLAPQPRPSPALTTTPAVAVDEDTSIFGSGTIATTDATSVMPPIAEMAASPKVVAVAIPEIAPAPATTPTAPVPDPLITEKLTKGMEQLAAGNAREAQTIFTDGLALYGKVIPQKLDDDARINLYHGLAIANLRTGNLVAARSAMDRVRAATKTNRSVQLNDAIIDVLTRSNLARGVDTIEKYLATNPADEIGVNILGFGINRLEGDASSRSRSSALWLKYQRYESQLTPPAPGLHHWGSRWISSDEMRAIELEKRQLEQSKAQLRREILKAQSAVDRAHAEASSRQAAYDRVRMANPRDSDLPYLAGRANEASSDFHSADQDLQKLRNELFNMPDGPKPAFDPPPKGVDPELALTVK
jgi:hypothetical protein